MDGGEPVRTGAYAAFLSQKLTPRSGAYAVAPETLLPDGKDLLFSARQGDTTVLWQIAFSSASGKVEGEARRITSGTEDALQPSSSRDLVVFSSQTVSVNIWTLPVDVASGKVTGELQRLTDGVAFQAYPSVSADGKKLAFVSARSGQWNVWLKDLETGQEFPLTHSAVRQYQPKITPDGSRVVYWQWDGQKSGSFTVDARGGVPEKLLESCGPPTHISPDGAKVLLETFTCVPSGLILADLAGGKQTHFIVADKSREHIAYSGRFSPDQRWVAFHCAVTGTALRRLYVAPVKEFASPIPEREWIPISEEGINREAAWSPSGHLVYYLSDRDGFRCVWAQRLDLSTGKPAGPATAVQHFHAAGRSILGVGGSAGAVGLTVLRDRLVLALGDRRGNIWALKVEDQK
jgi:Tol biopolymer transport system component